MTSKPYRYGVENGIAYFCNSGTVCYVLNDHLISHYRLRKTHSYIAKFAELLIGAQQDSPQEESFYAVEDGWVTAEDVVQYLVNTVGTPYHGVVDYATLGGTRFRLNDLLATLTKKHRVKELGGPIPYEFVYDTENKRLRFVARYGKGVLVNDVPCVFCEGQGRSNPHYQDYIACTVPAR